MARLTLRFFLAVLACMVLTAADDADQPVVEGDDGWQRFPVGATVEYERLEPDVYPVEDRHIRQKAKIVSREGKRTDVQWISPERQVVVGYEIMAITDRFNVAVEQPTQKKKSIQVSGRVYVCEPIVYEDRRQSDDSLLGRMIFYANEKAPVPPRAIPLRLPYDVAALGGIPVPKGVLLVVYDTFDRGKITRRLTLRVTDFDDKVKMNGEKVPCVVEVSEESLYEGGNGKVQYRSKRWISDQVPGMVVKSVSAYTDGSPPCTHRVVRFDAGS